MRSTAQDSPAQNLRLHLRAATMAAHDLLDHTMQAASGWQTAGDYARFLALQHAARVPVEAWLADHAPAALCPPPQTPLIACDLARLGLAPPPAAPAFVLAASGGGEVLGTAWVLAGSALGNRAILKQMRRASAADKREWPSAFLGDGAMLAFWQALRERIEQPASAEDVASATRAASAVFTHFTAHAAGYSANIAA